MLSVSTVITGKVMDFVNPALFQWNEEDPFAVYVEFQGTQSVIWVFALDLLRAGGGEGDVVTRIFQDTFYLTLRNANTTMTIAFPNDDINRFVSQIPAIPEQTVSDEEIAAFLNF